MKLYKISQKPNGDYGTYECAIVAAPDEETAKRIHPGGGKLYSKDWEAWDFSDNWHYCCSHEDDPSPSNWAKTPALVDAELIGVAKEGTQIGVILASFKD